MRNPGIKLELALLGAIALDTSNIERRYEPDAADLTSEDAALAIRCMDLTSLNSDDTPGRIATLCDRAREHSVAAVCVYPFLLPVARHELKGSAVAAATVAAGFPHGLSPWPARVLEVEECASIGASEIDVVISRPLALAQRWRELYDEIKALRDAANPAILKVIIGSGELPSVQAVANTALVALMAGADFVKTSTGKEKINATLPAGTAIATAIRTYDAATGIKAGIKPAGGIKSGADAAAWIRLVRHELGEEWLKPSHFRIGASSLLDDLVSRT